MANNNSIALKAVTFFLALAPVIAAACGQFESDLDRYSESMNPVLQRHSDLFLVDFQEILDSLGKEADALNAASEIDAEAAKQLIDSFDGDLKALSIEMQRVAQDWHINSLRP